MQEGRSSGSFFFLTRCFPDLCRCGTRSDRDPGSKREQPRSGCSDARQVDLRVLVVRIDFQGAAKADLGIGSATSLE